MLEGWNDKKYLDRIGTRILWTSNSTNKYLVLNFFRYWFSSAALTFAKQPDTFQDTLRPVSCKFKDKCFSIFYTYNRMPGLRRWTIVHLSANVTGFWEKNTWGRNEKEFRSFLEDCVDIFFHPYPNTFKDGVFLDFSIIFRPEMLKLHPYSILTGDTMVGFVLFCVLKYSLITHQSKANIC